MAWCAVYPEVGNTINMQGSYFAIRLALNTMTLQVTSVNVNSGQGVSISVTGIAQVRKIISTLSLLSLLPSSASTSNSTY